MHRSRVRQLAVLCLVGALTGAALVAAATTADAAGATGGAGAGALHAQRVCPPEVDPTRASCLSKVLVDEQGAVPRTATPSSSAKTPEQLRDAYKVTSGPSGTPVVAVVDAYGYPNLAADLATYRAYWSLPACTVASGCLTIMNQNGSTDPANAPRFDAGWAGEQALDVDAVSAICPACKILVVQAKSNSFGDLGAAVNRAAQQPGVIAISNSYGGGDLKDSTYGSFYNHPGIAITASTGDNGYRGGSYPASSSYVTAVGGTRLVTASGSRGWSETAWSGAGSGCSAYNTAVVSSTITGCSKRAIADVSAAADPDNGGMAVYWPATKTSSTWAQVGGTSESAPIIAAIYAISGKVGSAAGGGKPAVYANALLYSATSSNFFDITSGSNGSCTTTKWCTAGTGWDGPTGLGTPNGVGGF